MAMTSVLSRVPISVTRPMESALGSTRCFSECKGPVSVSVTRPMESNRGATLCLSVRKDRAQNHDCAADNNNMQIFGTWNRRRDCWKNYSVRWSEGMPEKSINTADQSEQEDDALKLREVELVLKALNKGIDTDHLYQEVIKVEGFKFMLASAFKHLMGDEKVARGFLAKNAKFRKFLLNKFSKNHGN